MSRNILSRAVISASAASVLSAAVVAARAKHDSGSAVRGVNDTSHWLWGDRAYAQARANWKFTIPGYLIHHLSSIFWALFFERLLQHRRGRAQRNDATATRLPAAGICVDAAAIATLANIVDYQLTPQRLTPGFERHLTRPSLALVYLAFGAGLAVAACFGSSHRTHP